MTNSNIPSVLKEQLEKLEALKAAPEAQEAPVAVEPIANAQATPAVASEAEIKIEPKKDTKEVAEQPLTEAAQVLGKTKSAPDEAQAGNEWKHKYDVINGKYVKETHELREQAKKHEQEAAEARRELEELRKAKPVEIKDLINAITDEEVRESITEDLLDEYGMDYWKQQIALQRKASPAAKNASGEDRLKEIEARLQAKERDSFYSRLTESVPNWEKINSSPAWNAFLGKQEPLSGATYSDLLMNAYEGLDSARVATLFKKFAQESGTKIDRQVMPSTAGADAPEASQGKTMTEEQWVREMSSLVSSGMSPMALVKRQSELMAMRKEGRVIGAQSGDKSSGGGFV